MDILRQIRNLEKNGDFSVLISLLEEQPRTGEPRLQAAYARALAFCERVPEARQALQALRPGRLDDETRVVYLLARSRLSRTHARWNEAYLLAEEALEIAKRFHFAEQAAEAEFAMAICHAERGRLFLGLDLFEKLSAQTQLSAFRRGLAASNAAWILWDLGREEAYQRVLPKIPISHRPRHTLAFSLLQGDLSIATSLLKQGLPRSLAPNQELMVTHLIVLGVVVLGEGSHREILRKSWVPDVLDKYYRSRSALQRIIANRALVLATQGKTKLNGPPKTPMGWRQQVECHLFEALIALDRAKSEEALKIYCQEINPILDQMWLKTPLIPRLLGSRFEQNSPWSKALHSKLKLRKETPAQRSVRLIGSQVIYQKGALSTELNLSKSPTSLKLLRILLEKAETHPRPCLSKAELHHRLTGSVYVPELHDGRLLKLLSRLEAKLQGVGIPRLWDIPGDNTVIIQKSSELQAPKHV